jgi:homoserine kinase
MKAFRLHLPATSANLGPGFDALGVAMSLYLTVDAETAAVMKIEATGRDATLCGSLKNNLILDTYADVLKQHGKAVTPLHLRMQNEIPLGMGCGSSAAALLAGVALAVHFGELGWSDEKILTEACVREGHPDNVAACWLGGLTVSAMTGTGAEAQVHAVSLKPKYAWPLLLVLPQHPLSTSKARQLLPETYSRADVVFNLQRIALLLAAFIQGRGELLHTAMQDKIHQPYRAELCRLLPALSPLAGDNGVLGVVLSGAGPAVLLVLEAGCDSKSLKIKILEQEARLDKIEILECGIDIDGALKSQF